MARLNNLISHLPSLYRPEPGDNSLLLDLLRGWGKELDTVSDLMTDVMQSHWHGFADRAIYSPYFNRDRQQRKLGPISPASTVLAERQLLNEFPYINDLARLGALVGLPVWREPSELRETVEAYRLRLVKMFEIYRNGLGTLDAVRAMVEANLPLDMAVPLALRQRSFSIEEYAPFALQKQDVLARGAPTEFVGPLMRWDLTNSGLHTAQPTVYIQGLAAQPDKFDATLNPLIERLSNDGITGLGLAFMGTVAPDSVLRISPVPVSYVAMGDQLQQAQGAANQQRAIGPWVTMAEQPGNPIVHLCQAVDHTLWAVLDNAGTHELWRYRGNGWLQVQAGFAFSDITMLKAYQNDLYLGDNNGLHLIPCLPAVQDDYAIETSSLFSDRVFDMCFDGSQFWFATQSGIFIVPQGGTEAIATPVQEPTYCICQAANKSLYFGGEQGVYHYHPGYHRWTILVASSSSDLQPDWQVFTPDNLPTTFIPPVVGLVYTADASLWMATSAGLARYFCYKSGEAGVAYSTQLQAFPDITPGALRAIKQDESGQLWCAGADGLFRFDGRDFLQYVPGSTHHWQPLGAAALLYLNEVDSQPRGRWRFDKSGTPTWHSLDAKSGAWKPHNLPQRSAAADPVNAFLWSHSIEASLGTWIGDAFEPSTPVPLSNFVMRVKPSATQILDGGLVALPGLERGQSTWRYLSRESNPAHVPAKTPWWSREGRLVPSPNDHLAPYPGRFRVANPEPSLPALPSGRYDEVVYAYLPAAKVTFEWAETKPFSLLIRLTKRTPDEDIHPAILDRVFTGVQLVKPAGAHIALAVEQQIVRGAEL